jgi:hypothetical protein
MDVPRFGALSLLQKSLHHKGIWQKSPSTLNVKLCVLVMVAQSQLSETADSFPLLESIWPFKNNFESSPRTLLGNFDPEALVE